jgi:hypothetical protein
VPRPRSGSGADREPVHLLVDSTGLKLCGAGEWLIEKHGTKIRRSWRKLHIGDCHVNCRRAARNRERVCRDSHAACRAQVSCCQTLNASERIAR